MKVERSNAVVHITISDIMQSHRLDPIRVTLDDIEPGRGRITIECYGRAWASYWGAMGDQGIAQFFASCDNHYLIKNLSPGLNSSRFSGEALAKFARKTICLRRRFRDHRTQMNYGSLDKEQARELFDEADDLSDCETQDSCWSHSKLLEEVFHQEWWYVLGPESEEPNPEYGYLERICNAVREALKQIAPAAEKGQTP